MKKPTIIAGILFLLASYFVVSPSVYADEQKDAENNIQGAALELTPVNRRMELHPGDNREEHISVKNLNEETLTFSVYAAPFSNGDGGESQDFDTEMTHNQIYRWIRIKNANNEYVERADYTLEAGKTIDIDYIINVPDNAPNGGQCASIAVELAPAIPSEETDIITISRAAMVIFTEIPGETKRSSEITDIKASFVAINSDIGVQYTVKNTGNIDFQSTAEISITSIFGKELYHDLTISNVFPENSKTVTAKWGDTPTFGFYKFDYTVSALGVTTTGSRLVLAITPLVLGLFMVLFSAAIIFAVFLLKQHTLDKDKEIQIDHQ